MGTRGPTATGERREGDRHDRVTVTVKDTSEVIDFPAPPTDVDPQVQSAWMAYAESVVAGVVEEIDLPILVRWAHALDEWLRNSDLVKTEGPYTTGSQGQQVLSPVVKYVEQLEARIAKFEGQLGMTPMARARLGLTVAEGQLTAAQLNDMAKPQLPASEDTEDDVETVADVIPISTGWVSSDAAN